MATPADDETDLLLAFLRDHDATCPLCGYNLRRLSQPRCPECRQDLVLTVSLREVHALWLLVTAAPCCFSGIAAVLLLAMIVISVASGGWPPWFVLSADAFGLTSGAGAVALAVRRRSFMRQAAARQRVWGLAAWAVHIAAFVLLLLLAFWLG